jgi:hypothetical protein
MKVVDELKAQRGRLTGVIGGYKWVRRMPTSGGECCAIMWKDEDTGRGVFLSEEAWQLIDEACWDRYHVCEGIVHLNDDEPNVTLEDIVALYDAAIERLEKKK